MSEFLNTVRLLDKFNTAKGVDASYSHALSAHAPSNAQKNSDITKAEIEAKLIGEISTHTHAGGTSAPTPTRWGNFF